MIADIHCICLARLLLALLPVLQLPTLQGLPAICCCCLLRSRPLFSAVFLVPVPAFFFRLLRRVLSLLLLPSTLRHFGLALLSLAFLFSMFLLYSFCIFLHILQP